MLTTVWFKNEGEYGKGFLSYVGRTIQFEERRQ
jgi:hypothetical protein